MHKDRTDTDRKVPLHGNIKDFSCLRILSAELLYPVCPTKAGGTPYYATKILEWRDPSPIVLVIRMLAKIGKYKADERSILHSDLY
jgi:hypothetical protein